MQSAAERREAQRLEFCELGERLFGAEKWKYRLAAHFDVGVRTVHRWADPDAGNQPSRQMIETLREHVRVLERSPFEANLACVIELAKHEGLDPNVISAFLRNAAESTKTAKTPKDKIRTTVAPRLLDERLASALRQGRIEREVTSEPPGPKP